MIEVLIADDHKIFRRGLRQVLDDAPNIKVTGEAADGNEVLKKLRTKAYDVVLLDITMPGLNGLDTLQQIKTDYPQMPVLILSMHSEDQYALRVMKAGASGYLTKDTDEKNIIDAVNMAYNKGKFITPSVAEKLAFAFEVNYEKKPHELLSNREFQVLQLIASGKSTGDIAKELYLGASTISTYRSRVLEKIGLKNNSEITHYAIKNNLLD